MKKRFIAFLFRFSSHEDDHAIKERNNWPFPKIDDIYLFADGMNPDNFSKLFCQASNSKFNTVFFFKYLEIKILSLLKISSSAIEISVNNHFFLRVFLLTTHNSLYCIVVLSWQITASTYFEPVSLLMQLPFSWKYVIQWRINITCLIRDGLVYSMRETLVFFLIISFFPL